MKRSGVWMGALAAALALAAVGDASSGSTFGRATALSAKGGNTCALTRQATVVCWGIDALGSQSPSWDEEPDYKPALVWGATNAKQVATGAWGFGHACFVTSVGSVKCWGHDEVGRGYDDPTVVPGLEHGILSIASGYDYACALTDGGAVKCWGNVFGDVNGLPQTVAGLSSGVRSIGAGSFHTCAAIDSGGLKCWGDNSRGELGDGTTTSSPTPVDVVGIHSVVSEIAAGGASTCALLGSGELKCWGDNSAGQLGDGTTVDRLTPVSVIGLPTATSVALGGGHSCAIANAALYCWGDNSAGQLGDGTTTGRDVPTAVHGLRAAPTQISAGDAHTCATFDDGSIECWGENADGELGIGNTTLHRSPVAVQGLSGRPRSISAGSAKSCALMRDGRVVCWGPRPYPISGIGSGNRALSSGAFHQCVLRSDRTVWCWGNNEYGQLGDGTTVSRDTPAPVAGLTGARQVAAGLNHTCALTQDKRVVCWGLNDFGQLGDGTTTSRVKPVAVAGLAGVRAITVGGDFSCALTARRHLRCWGGNTSGQLGSGSRGRCRFPDGEGGEVDWPCSLYPIVVKGLGGGIRAVSAGYNHICALTRTHRALCWGNDSDGQLGYLSSLSCDVADKEEDPCSPKPRPVSGLGRHVATLAAGGAHTCAVRLDHRGQCWGSNVLGQLGDGTDASTPDPTALDLNQRIRQIATGGYHTCALTFKDRVKCWGANWAGQLGNGTSHDMPTPQRVPGFG